jgi:multicomponent Na+:H+ antiporter subunit C
MSPLYAAVVGLMFAVSIYLLMRDSLVDHVFGLIILSHAANLFVFGAGRLVEGAPPILEGGSTQLTADPVPQALVLTAIVIGFGVIAFATLLVVRLYSTFDTDDVRVLEEVEHE